MPSPTMVESALALARQGWCVFPIVPIRADGTCQCARRDEECKSKAPGKHPAVEWGSWATTNLATIEAYWARVPQAGIGIATGSRSGVWVLDIDPRHDGDTSLAAAEKQRGALPTTLTCITGGGGVHYYWRYPTLGEGQTIKNKVNLIAGVDVRGDGGYVVVPPSKHASGKAYEWDLYSEDFGLMDAPAWLLEAVITTRAAGVQPMAAGTCTATTAYGRRALEEECKKARDAVPGTRNHVLFVAAGKVGGLIAGGEIVEDEGRMALYDAGNAAGDKGTEQKVRETVDRGLRKGALEPRSAPIHAVPTPARPRPSSPAPGATPVPPSNASSHVGKSAVPVDAGAPVVGGEWSAPPPPPEPPSGGGPEDERPVLVIVKNELARQMYLVEQYTAARHPNIYVRGGQLVQVTTSRTASPKFARILPSILQAKIDEAIAVRKWAPRRKAKGDPEDAPEMVLVPEDASLAMATRLHDQGTWRRFAEVVAVVEAPFLRPDFTVVERPGFDAATGIIFVPSSPYPPVPPNPTREDAGNAAVRLLEPFQEFKFANRDQDLSTLLAFIMTSVLRGAFETAPLFLIDSSTPGTGKSKIAQSVVTIATGRTWLPHPAVAKEEEFEKRLLGAALGGSTMFVIDNASLSFGFPTLDMALTTGGYTGRRLNETGEVNVVFRCTFCLTGNNLRLRGDLARRTLRIRLAPKSATPSVGKTYRHPDLLRYIKANRAQFAVDCLTIARAYGLEAARGPVASRQPPLGSFEGWDEMVRQPILWLGLGDVQESQRELHRGSDLYLDQMLVVLGAWEAAYGLGEAAKVRVRDVMNAFGQPEMTLRDAIHELTDNRSKSTSNPAMSAARALGQYVDRHIGPRVLRRTYDSEGALYYVERHETAPPAPASETKPVSEPYF